MRKPYSDPTADRALRNLAEQAERDSAEGAIPVVMFRRSREPWYVCLPAKEFFKMYRTPTGKEQKNADTGK